MLAEAQILLRGVRDVTDIDTTGNSLSTMAIEQFFTGKFFSKMNLKPEDVLGEEIVARIAGQTTPEEARQLVDRLGVSNSEVKDSVHMNTWAIANMALLIHLVANGDLAKNVGAHAIDMLKTTTQWLFTSQNALEGLTKLVISPYALLGVASLGFVSYFGVTAAPAVFASQFVGAAAYKVTEVLQNRKARQDANAFLKSEGFKS